MPQPQISVALVTRNRPESVARTLRSLRRQSVQPYEVVLSDDSDEQQANATRSVAAEYECRYVRGPRRGLYSNRNFVAAACGGTHIRTMDDDHEFPDRHWEACEAAVADDPGSIWIVGETVPSTGQLATDECPGELHPRGFSSPPGNPDDTWAIADGATIYPASIFREGVQFSEHFRFGATYLEFGSRLHYLGYRIRYLRGTYIVHHADFANRSFNDPVEDLAAKSFATLSHSFFYQPSLRNRFLTAAELSRDAIRLRRPGFAAVRRGFAAFREQRKSVQALEVRPR